MTKKRYVKLLRCFCTRVLEESRKQGMKIPSDIYRPVRFAKAGEIPKNYTRAEWFQAIKGSMDVFGMDNIKEYK